MRLSVRPRTCRSAIAHLAIALMLAVQVTLTIAGCLGTRTHGDAASPCDADPVARLVCAIHCQSEDEGVSYTGVPILALDQLPPVALLTDLTAHIKPASDRQPRLRLPGASPPGAPPPPAHTSRLRI